MRRYPYLLVSVCLLVAACQATPQGIHQTPDGSGPTVLFDLNAKPLPEIPFPNDLATRPDPSSATGLRVNASLVAPTVLEQKVRAKIDQLDGFGTFQPITVSFDGPLDIGALLARHASDLDYNNDAVFLVDIDPKSPDFGRPLMLDIGRGNYPLTLRQYKSYFPQDPRAQASNLLFETVEEDLNGNGIFDPGEDSDDDGVFDHPNVWPPGADPRDGLMTFYESETNTLILRPVVPLRERTKYAVVLTDRLVGQGAQPVRSPFEYVHHLKQSHELERLEQIFAGWAGSNLAIDNIAFAWSFTTQTISADLVAIREGLYGFGPLAWLAEDFSDQLIPVLAKSEGAQPPYYVVETQTLVDILELVGPSLFGGDPAIFTPLLYTYRNVDYLVSGSFVSPDFLRTNLSTGLDQENIHRENFSIDLQSGQADVESKEILFWLIVPKETEQHKPPFPVCIYAHGYGSARFEILGFAGTMARYGIATIGIDAWGHGVPLGDQEQELFRMATAAWQIEPFGESFLVGRARDLTGNGEVDSGGDFWTGYGFHIRDAVRQTVVDHLQMIRVLKGLDGSRTWEIDQDDDGHDDLAGDFNGDGRVDIGGPAVGYYAWGQSMGGIHSAIIPAVEPSITAGAPTCGAGGMADVGARTMLGSVQNGALLRTIGPLVVGQAGPQAELQVSLVVVLSAEERRLAIGRVAGVKVGDRVVATNLTKGEEHSARVREGLVFRLSMEADRDDRFEVAFYDSGGVLIDKLTAWQEDVWYFATEEPTYRAGEDLRSPTEGYGMPRNTPDLRKMLGLFQMILDPADPANYARFYFNEPLDIRPEGPTTTNLLEVATLGDQDVPIGTQAIIARAAGLIPYDEEDSRFGTSVNDWLIDNYVYEGLSGIGRFNGSDILFDPDDVDEGSDGFDAPAPQAEDRLRLVVETATGQSGVRFAYVSPYGQHGIFIPNPNRPFDVDSYFANQIARFFATNGTEILDDFCLEDFSCPMP
jgi:hypothetical protein